MSGRPSSIEVRRAVDGVRHALAVDDPPRLVVVGDVMLDRYVDGSSTRLSPEAPVPVVDVETEVEHLGGAANVALGLATLGARVDLIGMVGDDSAGGRVRALLDEVPRIKAHLVIDPNRMTTTKERVRVDGRHVIRVDRERTSPPPGDLGAAIAAATQEATVGAAALVVSDYNKGAIEAGLVASLVDRPFTLVDPKHADVERYAGADLLAPNRVEALAVAVPSSWPATDLSLAETVTAVAGRLAGAAIVVTAGADGLAWSGPEGADAGGSVATLPSLARRVVDVTGAGDSVVCGLAAASATGADLRSAVLLATVLAAVAVESPGTAAPRWDEVADLVGSLAD